LGAALPPVLYDLVETAAQTGPEVVCACNETGACAHDVIMCLGNNTWLRLMDPGTTSLRPLSEDNRELVQRVLAHLEPSELRRLDGPARREAMLTVARLQRNARLAVQSWLQAGGRRAPADAPASEGASAHSPDPIANPAVAGGAAAASGEGAGAGEKPAAGAEAKSEGTGEHNEPRITVKRWRDLAIGIDDKGRYLAVTPPPECGAVFPKEDSVELDLRGRRWKNLLDLLAQSEHGDAAEKVDVMMALGYLKRGEIAENATLEELKDDAGKMKLLKTASDRLTTAIADPGREIRRQVKAPTAKGEVVLSVAEGKVVQAAFVTRYLIQGSDGKLRFGKRRS